QFLDSRDEFDTIHPSLHRQSKLNNNYGLYELISGHIYQVRGFDLANITFVRPIDWLRQNQSDSQGGASTGKSAGRSPLRILSSSRPVSSLSTTTAFEG